MNSDPDIAGSGAIASAVAWLDGLALGALASVIAIIAVASIGLLWLSGRIDVRRAARVIVGSFIIFGASTIANGIVGALSGSGQYEQVPAVPPPPPPVVVTASGRPLTNTPYDPYAGAALPPRH